MSMASRFAACVIVASWVLAPPTLRAQPGPGGPAYGPPPGGYVQEGLAPMYAPMHPGACGCPSCSAGGLMMRGGPIGHGFGGGVGIQTYHGRPTGFDDVLEVSPFERFLTKVMRNMWIRLEYLSWDLDDPGDELLGEPPFSGNPLVPRPVFEEDPLNPGVILISGRANALDLERVSLLDTDGVRGTIGIPYREFDYEWSWWLLEQNSDFVVGSLPDPQVPGNADFVFVPTRIDGERVDDTFLLFDESYRADFTSEMWGTDMKWVFPLSPQWPGLRVDPLIEARYVQFRENLHQAGVFSGAGTLAGPLANPLVTVIDSDAVNHIYGAGVGVRAQFVHPWVTVGIEPRVSLALNTYRSRVSSENVLAAGDGQVTEDESTTFSPTLEVQAYFRLHPSPHWTLVGGYNLLILSQAARPHDSIRYNLISDPATGNIVASDIGVDTEHSTMWVHGWSVGAEFTFR